MSAKSVTGAVTNSIFRIVLSVAIIFLVYKIAMGAYNFGYRLFADIPAALSPGQDVTVTITESMEPKEIAKDFEELGLVQDWKLFYAQIYLSEYKEELIPGVYTLNTSMKAEDMLLLLATPIETGEE